MNQVFLGIGTNLGNRENNLKEVLGKIEEHIGRILHSSSIYETAPWGFSSSNDFLNMVIRIETMHSPSELLQLVLMVESMFGRVRNGEQYSSRIIDIDILLYEDLEVDQAGLKIPHPRMHERMFVLAPLCEVAPDVLHPVLRKSIRTLYNSCKDSSKVTKFL